MITNRAELMAVSRYFKIFSSKHSQRVHESHRAIQNESKLYNESIANLNREAESLLLSAPKQFRTPPPPSGTAPWWLSRAMFLSVAATAATAASYAIGYTASWHYAYSDRLQSGLQEAAYYSCHYPKKWQEFVQKIRF